MSHERRSGVTAILSGVGWNIIPRLSPRCLKYVSLLLMVAVFAGGFLSACSPPRPAPVVSREYRKPVVKPRSGYYRVRRGDTLYSIAWHYGYDHRRMAAWNGIRPPYTIYPGQLIRTRPPARTRVATKTRNPKTPTRKASVVPKKKNTTVKKSTASQKKKSTWPASVKLRWQWPTKGKVIQSFSNKDPNRKGIKLAGYAGEPVHASESGKVVYSGSGLIGYGKLIIVKHNNDYLSAYGHNRKLLVKEGDWVTRGKRIAEIGNSGAGQAQLHFEIRRNGNPVNPATLLPRRR